MKPTAQKFDLIVQHRDKKTGRVVSENPYRMRKHEGVSYFERPKGSGNLFFENNEPAGRYAEGKFLPNAPHIEWAAPLSEDEKIKQAVAAAQDEAARLKAELAEIKREQKYAGSKAKETAPMAKAMKPEEAKQQEK